MCSLVAGAIVRASQQCGHGKDKDEKEAVRSEQPWREVVFRQRKAAPPEISL